MEACIALETGRIFPGRLLGAPREAGGEVVFHTGMTGYQEILTDPSYSGQMVVMTYPLIGNYGINPEDVESDRIQVAAFIIKEYQPYPSNYRSTASLADYLIDQNIMGVEGLDTRAITRHIRNAGAMRAVISTDELSPDSLVKRANEILQMAGLNLAKVVTTPHPYYWENGKYPDELEDLVITNILRRQEITNGNGALYTYRSQGLSYSLN